VVPLDGFRLPEVHRVLLRNTLEHLASLLHKSMS
jgi:hypothetical protein